MTRISSAMIPAASLADLSRAQQALVEAARQSSAQTKASDLKGYGREAQTLVSAQRLVSRTEGFLVTSREPLRVGAEHCHPLAPLSDAAAVELLVARTVAAARRTL